MAKYADFANMFLKKLVKIIFKQIEINEYAIKLIKDKQPFYWSIYSLG